MNLTHANYHGPEANLEYMSVHQYQDWLECAARTRAELRGEWNEKPAKPGKDALLAGSYFHCLVLQPELIPQFKEQHPDLCKKNGEIYTDYAEIESMVPWLLRDPWYKDFLSKGEFEKIITFPLFGCEWKAQIDQCDIDGVGFFTDYKTTASFSDVWTETVVQNPRTGEMEKRNIKVPWYDRYWRQIAVYFRGLEIATGKSLGPHICGITKDDPPDRDIWVMNCPERIAAELHSIEEKLPEVLAWKAGTLDAPMCGHCDYCRERKQMRILQAVSYNR